MTKNEFKAMAKERGITDCRYQGWTKTMYISGDMATTDAFKLFIKQIDLPFSVKVSNIYLSK